MTRYWMKASLSLTIVMGIGWIVNILFFSQHLLFVAYIMTIFIASQGIIIFILYVPLSSHVSKIINNNVRILNHTTGKRGIPEMLEKETSQFHLAQ